MIVKNVFIRTRHMRITDMRKQVTAIIERENNGYVSLCPELDIASQGDSVEEARDNLREAIELFLNLLHHRRYKTGSMRRYTLPGLTWQPGKLQVLSGKEVWTILINHRFHFSNV